MPKKPSSPKTFPPAPAAPPPGLVRIGQLALDDRAVSFGVRKVIERATAAARTERGTFPLTTSGVFFAITGYPEVTTHEVAAFFRRFLNRPEDYLRVRQEYYRRPKPDGWITRTGQVTLVSRAVVRLLGHAEQIALATTGSKRVHTRHLFAAILSPQAEGEPAGADNRLAELDVDRQLLGRRFLDFVREFRDYAGDRVEDWRTCLGVEDETGRPEGRGDSPPPNPSAGEAPAAPDSVAAGSRGDSTTDPPPRGRSYLPGFHTDGWDGRDLLGIGDDVEALAKLVAAWGVEPPLSVGLFGDWGSGKSFFMKQLRQRVTELAGAAGRQDVPQRELAYCRHVVQIEFNAWQYMEANLWASLSAHIFAELQLDRDGAGRVVPDLRESLRSRVQLQREKVRTAAEKQAQLAEDVRKAKEDVEQKRAELARQGTSAATVISQALSQVRLPQEERDRIAAAVAPLTGPVEQARSAAREAVGLGQLVRAELHRLRTDPARRRVARVLLALMVLLPLLYSVVLVTIPVVRDALAGAVQAAVGVLTFITPALAWLAGRVTWLRWSLGRFVREVNEGVDREENEREQKLGKEKSKLERATAELTTARAQTETARAGLQRLQEQLDAADPDRVLREFIAERAGSDDYNKLLSVLAIVRRDFVTLSNLCAERRRREERGDEDRGQRVVNRVILYIDDLDRCPPEQVVAVLQAIHLLLAFKLFVVVVAVDARWVQRALQEQFTWLGEDGGEAPTAPTGAGQAATSHDYLEKIFQIPFWVRPMEPDACATLIETLAQPVPEAPGTAGAALDHPGGSHDPTGPVSPPAAPAGAAPAPAGAAGVAPTPAEAPGPAAGRTVASTPPRPLAEIDLQPLGLRISEPEVLAMRAFAVVVGRSPRAAKRFVNCYRLLRAGLSPDQLRELLGDAGRGWYREVLLFLGVVVGTPELARPLLGYVLRLRGRLRRRSELVSELDNHFHRSPPDGWDVVRPFLGDRLPGRPGGLRWNQAKFRPYLLTVSRLSFRTQGGGLPELVAQAPQVVAVAGGPAGGVEVPPTTAVAEPGPGPEGTGAVNGKQIAPDGGDLRRVPEDRVPGPKGPPRRTPRGKGAQTREG